VLLELVVVAHLVAPPRAVATVEAHGLSETE
jgi:hypothetical protein